MATQGTAVVNFGTGALDASVVVTGQSGLTSGNLVEAWALCNETVGTTNDDSAWVEQMTVLATRIVAGVGFTIVMKPAMRGAIGSYNVGWVWN